MKTPTPEIRQALYKRLLCALPMGPITEKDVSWPNSQFRPRPDQYYLAPYCIYAGTETRSLSRTGFELLTGIFQISIYGILNTSEGILDELARDLIDLYRGGTDLEMTGYNPILILRAYRSELRIETGGETARPVITVSADWHQYTPKH